MTGARTLVIGVGNRYRSDDALGPIVIDQLAGDQRSDVAFSEVSGEGGKIIELLRSHQSVIIVDAVNSGTEPGTIYHLNLNEEELPSGFLHYSSHAFGVAEAVAMTKSLGEVPESLHFYGIEGGDFSSGIELSAEVAAAVPELITRVRSFLSR